jgi:cell division protein FtsL
MVRATVGIRTPDRHLVVVPEPRGRRFAGFAVVASVVLGLAMLGAAAFQTQLAQRQVQLDQLDSDIEAGREQYESLRRQRSELRSPARLGEVAAANGMVPANDSAVMQISPDVMALAVAASGDLDPAVLGDGRSTLDDFREVKATTSAMAAP